MSEKLKEDAQANNSSGYKGISRLDAKNTHGWFVRIYHESSTYSKLFSDKKFGGREESLQKALEYRNEMMEKIGKTYPARRVVCKDSRNKTGVIGVCRTRKANRNGIYSEYFSVSWSPKYRSHKCRMFSINKYGEEQAFELACEWRKKMESEIHGVSWVKPPKEVPKYVKPINPLDELPNLSKSDEQTVSTQDEVVSKTGTSE